MNARMDEDLSLYVTLMGHSENKSVMSGDDNGVGGCCAILFALGIATLSISSMVYSIMACDAGFTLYLQQPPSDDYNTTLFNCEKQMGYYCYVIACIWLASVASGCVCSVSSGEDGEDGEKTSYNLGGVIGLGMCIYTFYAYSDFMSKQGYYKSCSPKVFINIYNIIYPLTIIDGVFISFIIFSLLVPCFVCLGVNSKPPWQGVRAPSMRSQEPRPSGQSRQTRRQQQQQQSRNEANAANNANNDNVTATEGGSTGSALPSIVIVEGERVEAGTEANISPSKRANIPVAEVIKDNNNNEGNQLAQV